MNEGMSGGGRPLALVLGAEHPTGLGGGRALHLAGADTWGICGTATAPTCRSRVWRELVVLNGAAEEWVTELKDLGRRLPRPAFLLPTQDSLVEEISGRREELSGPYRFVLPEHEVVRVFLDKTRFYSWARPLGLPLPESEVVTTETDLRAALRDMPYPLVVKPLYRTRSWQEVSPVQKVLRFEGPEDLDRVGFDLFAAAPAFLISQWISGPDSSVHYCLAYCHEPGRMTAWYTGRKLLQYPRQTGSTAVCVGTQNEEVRELAEEVFAQAGFQGLGSLEVKYDRDGRPHITEPTVGRPNLQSFSAVAAGCNLHGLAMAHALGLEWAPSGRRVRNSWWVEERAVRELARIGGGGPIPWRLLGTELVRARRASGAYWIWWDPSPFLSLLSNTANRVVRRGLDAVRAVFRKPFPER